jgi:hypothetical protein
MRASRKSSPFFGLVAHVGKMEVRCDGNWPPVQRRTIMSSDIRARRDVLQALAALPLMALVARSGEASAQTGVSPVKVDTKGLVAKIKFEAPLAGFLN